VLSLAVAVMAIALPDSLNPSLIGAELFLATQPHPGRRTVAFTLAAFSVMLVVGIALAVGLGDLIVSLLPKPGRTLKYAMVVTGGVVLLVGGAVVWLRRRTLAHRDTPRADQARDTHQSGALMGAGIAGLELFTAFPYFAAIALIGGSEVSNASKLALLVLYCLVYTAPLIAIAIACVVMGSRADAKLRPINEWMLARWPAIVGPLAFVIGIGVTAYGVVQLTR
jgi:cytochrome c biogenesis protein CcdA